MSHNKILWKSIVFLFLFVSGVFFIFSRASAASTVDWPSKAIRIVVPFPPGGNTDIVGRVLAEQLGQKLSVPVLVENRPGATGFIGTNYVIGQPSDGYTFLLSTISITISPHIYTSIPDDILSLLTPVSMVTTVPKVLVVRPGLPVSTVSELVEYAKEKNEPLTYGSSGIGSAHHLSGELFKLHYDVDLTHIPYKGGAPALNDLIGERIDIVFDDVPPAHPFIHAGKIKALAVSSNKRSTLLPDVSTAREVGAEEAMVEPWYGLLAPRDTPKSIVNAMDKAVESVINGSEFQEKVLKMGGVPSYKSAKDFGQFVLDENQRWGSVIEEARIPPQ